MYWEKKAPTRPTRNSHKSILNSCVCFDATICRVSLHARKTTKSTEGYSPFPTEYWRNSPLERTPPAAYVADRPWPTFAESVRNESQAQTAQLTTEALPPRKAWQILA